VSQPRAETQDPPRSRAPLIEYLGLERNVVAVAGAMFLLGLGQELWKRFIPKYLEALGAPVRMSEELVVFSFSCMPPISLV
jgi:hypothetical protein